MTFLKPKFLRNGRSQSIEISHTQTPHTHAQHIKRANFKNKYCLFYKNFCEKRGFKKRHAHNAVHPLVTKNLHIVQISKSMAIIVQIVLITTAINVLHSIKSKYFKLLFFKYMFQMLFRKRITFNFKISYILFRFF